jgi:hypothetical protein
MTRCSSAILAAASMLICALALAPTAQAESRGELLYATHCLACHTSQMHWRDKKQATDWNSLKAQVRQWQAVAVLGWSEDDILGVTRYLNEGFYGFSQTSDPRSSSVPSTHRGQEATLASIASKTPPSVRTSPSCRSDSNSPE